MKQIAITTFFWSGLTATVSLFLLLIIWSLFPFGGATLPHVLERFWAIPFRVAALLISLACGLSAVGAMSLSLLNPAPGSVHGIERNEDATC